MIFNYCYEQSLVRCIACACDLLISKFLCLSAFNTVIRSEFYLCQIHWFIHASNMRPAIMSNVKCKLFSPLGLSRNWLLVPQRNLMCMVQFGTIKDGIQLQINHLRISNNHCHRNVYDERSSQHNYQQQKRLYMQHLTLLQVACY